MLIYIGLSLIVVGLMFATTVAVSLIKNSNTYTSIHTAGVTDATGNAILLSGIAVLAFSFGEFMVSIKILLLVSLIYIVGPIYSYCITKALYFYENETMDKK